MRKSLEKCLKLMFTYPSGSSWMLLYEKFRLIIFLKFLILSKKFKKDEKNFSQELNWFLTNKKKLFLPSSFFNWNLAQSNFIKLWIFTVTCTMLSLILGVMSLISTFELKFHHKIRSYFTTHCPQYTFQVIMIFFWNYIIII